MILKVHVMPYDIKEIHITKSSTTFHYSNDEFEISIEPADVHNPLGIVLSDDQKHILVSKMAEICALLGATCSNLPK